MRLPVLLLACGLCGTSVSASERIFANDRYTMLNIIPCSPGEEDVAAADSVEYFRRTGQSIVLYSLTLHPQGRPAMKVVDECVASYRRFAALLKGTGVRPGILLQAIIGHWTQDRADRDVEPWQKAVNRKGETTRQCPLDPGYRAYIREVGAKLASCAPCLILSDDDVRSFSPQAECFCPLHTVEFNRRTGRTLTPEAYRELIAKSEVGSQAHTAFAELQRDTIRDHVCAVLREGIDSVNPSIPAGVCQPGRAWERLRVADYAAAIAAKGQETFFRLGNAQYGEWAPKREIPYLTLRTLALFERLGGSANYLLDEGDTWPHNRWEKSAVAMHVTLSTGAFSGMKGAKIWMVNAHKNGLPVSRRYTDILADHRGFYDALARASNGSVPTGVLIPCHRNFPRTHVTADDPPTLFDENEWAQNVFGYFGIPFSATLDYSKDGVYAIAGEKMVDGFADDELRQMLSHAVLLDGGAVKRLVGRGFGNLLGVTVRTDDPPLTGERDERDGRMLPFPKSSKPVLLVAEAGAETLASIVWRASTHAREFERVAPSSVLFANALGGRVLSLSYHMDMAWYVMRSEARKLFFEHMLDELAGRQVDNVIENEQDMMALSRRSADDVDLLYCVNLGFDDAGDARIRRRLRPARIEELSPNGAWSVRDNVWTNGVITVSGTWPSQCVRVFRFMNDKE